MDVKEFFDSETYTLTYVVMDLQSRDAVIIDPVWDYDPASASLQTKSVEQVIKFVHEKGLVVHYILETHAHADHLSGAQVLKGAFPEARVAIGARIRDVQKLFKGIFNLSEKFAVDGSQFDELLTEDQEVCAGTLKIRVLYTPGHTPACASYVINSEAVFTGDALFMPDYGTGRCDFPAGSAEDLYKSISQKLYVLPDDVKVYVGHDYQPGGRQVRWQTTIGESKKSNIQLNSRTGRDEYVKLRTTRDASLAAPKLLFPSVQVNINGGRLPEREANGSRYLKIPIKVKEPKSLS